MTYLIATVLTVVNLVWLLLVVVGLPGTWLMVAGTLLVAWWRWDAVGGQPMFTVPVLVTIVVLALAGEALELVTGMVGSKAAGGTKRGAVGALVGALVGAIAGTVLIPLPVVGSLVGTCGGAAIGAWAMELSGGRAMNASVKSGVGAGVGRLAGTVTKLGIGLVIWVVVAVAAYWP